MPPDFSEEEVTAGARWLYEHDGETGLIREDWTAEADGIRAEYVTFARDFLEASGAVPRDEYEREHNAANRWSRDCVDEAAHRVAAELELERFRASVTSKTALDIVVDKMKAEDELRECRAELERLKAKT